MERRRLLQATAAAAGAVPARRVPGANDRVVMGLIGCGGRGRYVAGFMKEAPNTEFAAAADVYLANAEKARQWAGPRARAFQDFRRLLELKEVDAVLIATPDHWHATCAVLALQAGKDVYVEKPLAYSIREGRAIVNAARRHGRIAVAGTQHRSSPHFAECARIVQSGELGEVRFVRVWNYVNRSPKGIGNPPDSDPPEGLDWDFYLGPAPKVPFNRARFLATYRMFRDYSGGWITDYGTHRFDTVHQIMGVDQPAAVSASGGRFTLKDAGDVPDTIIATYEYPGFVLSYEGYLLNGHGCGGRTPGMKYYNMRGNDDRPNGMAFYGTNGALFADRIGYEIYAEPKQIAIWGGPSQNSPEPRIEPRRMNTTDATALHARHFIECVRERKPSYAGVEIGQRATSVAHLGNIALRTGRKLRWDAATETFPGDSGANALLHRTPRKPWDLVRF
jgi:predicted dehydrogenase